MHCPHLPPHRNWGPHPPTAPSAAPNRCRLKIAEFSAELGQYPRAVEMFEEALKRAVQNNLLKFSVGAHALQWGLCAAEGRSLCSGTLRAAEGLRVLQWGFALCSGALRFLEDGVVGGSVEMSSGVLSALQAGARCDGLWQQAVRTQAAAPTPHSSVHYEAVAALSAGICVRSFYQLELVPSIIIFHTAHCRRAATS